jgi:integrase
MSLEEVQKCFAVLEQQERLIVKFAVLAGLRPGEIFGLKWGRLSETHADIRQRVYRGRLILRRLRIRSGRLRLSAGLLADIEIWRTVSLDPSPDAWVFPSETGKTPLGRDNVWRRRIGPRLKEAGLKTGWIFT